MEGTGYLGFDASGVVDEVGDGVTGVAVGDEVLGTAAIPRPSSPCWTPGRTSPPRSMEQAAAAGVASETASGLLLGVQGGDPVRRRRAGGVGGGSPIAVARGATVIASASSRNHDYLREIGAIPVPYGLG